MVQLYSQRPSSNYLRLIDVSMKSAIIITFILSFIASVVITIEYRKNHEKFADQLYFWLYIILDVNGAIIGVF
jgi:hypothetical protein